MSAASKRQIYFSFFMFTADLQPDNKQYRDILVSHLKKLGPEDIGYNGFDLHIASPPPSVNHDEEIYSYRRLKQHFDENGLRGVKFTTNVGTTRYFNPSSLYAEERQIAWAYLKSRVDITSELGGESIMAGPFLYPYGVFPVTDAGDSFWSDALVDWLKPRYAAAQDLFGKLGDYAARKRVKLAIEPVKSWETPGPNSVSDVIKFLRGVKNPQCGVAIDSAQVVMESEGPEIFRNNVKWATQESRLHYVHISPPDRGAVQGSWIPWEIILGEIDPVYTGPYLVEIFNAIPPFANSMRMARRRFWRSGEDDREAYPESASAYDVARDALKELEKQIARVNGTPSDSSRRSPGIGNA